MIDRAFVEACYRAVLGREPENEAVVLARLDYIGCPEDLIAEFLSSDEFDRHLRNSIGKYYSYSPPRISNSDVGRATKHLAERFDKILAAEISEGSLRQSRKMAAHFGIKKIGPATMDGTRFFGVNARKSILDLVRKHSAFRPHSARAIIKAREALDPHKWNSFGVTL